MKILVPLNGTLHSETVLPYVKGLARSWNARVVLLRVLDPLALAGDPGGAALAGREQETRSGAEAYLARVAEGFEGTLTRCICQVGLASETICQQAGKTGCDLIVFAPHGHSGLERWLFGSVAEEVARQAPCPVMLVRGETNICFHHVLIPTDGSEGSEQVCRLMANFAPGEARVTLLHCTSEEPLEKALQARLQACVSQHPNWNLKVVKDRPKAGIIDWVLDSDCDLIAMATHGRGGLSHLWSGSVTEEVARQSPCPVLVFPPAYLNQPIGEA
jgi:nucleotide-binding universal stress UspA family protein